MLEVTHAAVKPGDVRRVLGLEPAVLASLMAALLLTAGVLLLLGHLRQGVLEPVNLPIFRRLFAFEDYPAAFLFIAVLLVAAIPDLQELASQLARQIGEHPVVVAVASSIALAAGALWVYHAHPLSMDEAAPYMQSKVFAEGALFGKYPSALKDWLIFPPFQDYFIHVSPKTGEIASAYWPGFALLLTPFMAAGVPWLCNPVLGGLSVWVVHRLTLRLTSSVEAAGTAALFSLASAAFVINSISFYSMTAHLLCNAVFALLLLAPTPRRALLAGVVGGLALTLHNPVPHTLFAAPWLIWLLTQKNRWSLLGALAAGYLPWIIVVGFGWNLLLHNLRADSAAVAAPGSQIDSALAQLTATFRLPGAPELMDRLVALAKFWLWAAPLTVLLAGVGFWRHRANIHLRLLLISALTTFVGYLFVPLNQGHGWGFRYLHSAWFVLPILAAAALVPSRKSETNAASSSFARVVQAGALGGLLIMVPFFAWQVNGFMSAHLAQLPTTDHGAPRVIFINSTGYYSQDLVQNDPFLREPVIRMVTHGRVDDAKMMAQWFPDLVLLKRSINGAVWGLPESATATHNRPKNAPGQ